MVMDLRDYSIIFSNILRTMIGILKFCTNCVGSVEWCWRLLHNLVFILRVENGFHGKRKRRISLASFHRFSSNFHHRWKDIMYYPTKITVMILKIHNFANCLGSHLVDFSKIWTTMLLWSATKILRQLTLSV